MNTTSPLRLCVMQGDGIGPEITAATLGVLRAAGKVWRIEFAFDEVPVGLEPLKSEGTTFPEASFAAAQSADGVILGPVSHNDYPPAEKGGINPSGALRKRLDLFANIRPAKTRAQFPARCGKPRDPDIAYEEKIVDAVAALLVRDASQFDVIVTTNMFGDILSDEASEIAGSLGLAESINAGAEHAMAQAQHGSAPDIAGQDKANPASLIGSAAMLLAWLGERRDDARLTRAAAGIERALDAVIAMPEWRTGDLGGPLGTKAFGEKVAGALK